MNALLTIHEVVDENEWNAFFEQASRKHMTQTWAFGEAKRATNWFPKRLKINSDGEVIAIFQVLCKKIAGFTVASRVNLGPILLNGHTEKVLNVYAAVKRHWRYGIRGVLLIAPEIDYSNDGLEKLKALGFRLRTKFRWTSSRINLTNTEERLRSALNSKWRNQLKKSEGNGLQFSAECTPSVLEWMIHRNRENAANKGFEGPSAEFLQALHQASARDFHIFRAFLNGACVAAIVVFTFCGVAHYYVGWFGSEGRRLNAGNFLLWNAVLELKRIGIREIDLGGHGMIGSTGFTGFKLGMNGEKYQVLGEFFCI